MPNRNLLYFFKLISSSVKRRNSYLHIEQHIQINLTWNLNKYLNYDITNRKAIKCYIMDEETHNKINSDVFEIIHVNMDYFAKMCYDKDIRYEYLTLMLLTAETVDEIDMIGEVDPYMKELGNKIKDLNKDPKILDVIIENEDEIIANTFFDKGLEEGIKQGIEEGKKEGIEQNKSEIAKNMLNIGLDMETILKCTGLSKNEIDSLK